MNFAGRSLSFRNAGFDTPDTDFLNCDYRKAHSFHAVWEIPGGKTVVFESTCGPYLARILNHDYFGRQLHSRPWRFKLIAPHPA